MVGVGVVVVAAAALGVDLVAGGAAGDPQRARLKGGIDTASIFLTVLHA